MPTVNAWGTSWGNSWLTSWTYTPAVAVPSGGAGAAGHRRRAFPFPNREDDPELFRPRPVPEKKKPEPVAKQPYTDGDPVKLPSGPTTLSELGSLAAFPRPPKPSKPRKRAPEPPASIAEPVPEPVEQVPPNEEEEMHILRMFGFL